MAQEDDIDNETLQAQIDLSMAYVHDMVCSWVKPSPTRSSSRNVEKEIQDYLRQPPRLGVGARGTVTATLPRETARLKGRLTKVNGKKRARDDNEVQMGLSDDEHESRAGAIQKKIKVSKKITAEYPQATTTTHPEHVLKSDHVQSSDAKIHSSHQDSSKSDLLSRSSSPEKLLKKRRKKKKKRLHDIDDARPDISSNSTTHLAHSLSENVDNRQRALKYFSLQGREIRTESDDSSDDGAARPIAPPSVRCQEQSLTSVTLKSHPPNLNLDGRSGEIVDDALPSPSEPRRKRKKRKRKKQPDP